MIEMIQQKTSTEEKTEARLPKNIRQIGNPENDYRIYMEDYVYTYLHPAQIQGIEIGVYPRLLILLGEIEHFSNRSCAFISGAVLVENESLSEEIPELTEDTWREIHIQMMQYFEKCEVVGWVLDIPGHSLHITETIEQIHRKNFIGTFQIFFLMDSKAREEAFYTWKQGQLTKKEGYFIYYEKNPQMQEYMISRREKKAERNRKPELVQDRAAKSYRALMLEKRERTTKKQGGILSYILSMLMVLTLCAISVLLLGSISRMKKMEQTITDITLQEDTESNVLDVETIRGEIIPVLAAESSEEDKTAVPNTNTQETSEAQKNANSKEISDTAENTNSKETSDTSENTNSKETSDTSENTNSQKLSDTQELSNPPENTKSQNASVESGANTAETDAVQAGANTTETDSIQAMDTQIVNPYLAQGYYIVQAGDNLQNICFTIYQTDALVDKLCEINGIEDKDTIYIGQKLTLP